MIKLLFISMLGLFTAFSSWDDSDVVEAQVDFKYKETGCANPWRDSQNYSDEEYLLVIDDYLMTDLGVSYQGLYITDDGYTSGCKACTCLTGDIIRFTADEEFSEILLENGFEIDE